MIERCPVCGEFSQQPCTWAECPKKENKQMTREEAEKIASMYGYNINTDGMFDGHGTPPEKQFIKTLEALGLLKFEQKVEAEKSKPSATTVICNELENQGPSSNYSHLANKIINELMKLRYKIVDTDVCEIVDKRQPEPSVLPICYRGYSSEQIDNLISQDKSKKLKHSSEEGKYIFFPHPDNGIGLNVLQSDAVKTMQKYGYVVEKKENGGETYCYATNARDRNFLLFIYNRLLDVHGERRNVDYMLTLKKFIDNWH